MAGYFTYFAIPLRWSVLRSVSALGLFFFSLADDTYLMYHWCESQSIYRMMEAGVDFEVAGRSDAMLVVAVRANTS